MRPDLQEAFIERVTPESYRRCKEELNAWLGMEIGYRVCEMPIFLSSDMRITLERAAADIIKQCVRPDYIAQSDVTLAPEYVVPHQNDRPLFSVVDFAICTDDDGSFVPKLIELQGFPSLFGYQYLYASTMRDFYGLPGVTPTLSGLTEQEYFDVLKRAIFATHDPAECALLEVDPDHQKTRTDFIAMERYIGLQTVDIRSVRKEGRHLMAQRNGRTVRLERVFNRAIVDELDDMGVTLPFSWTDDLDVEWAGHPNWYFRISKYSLPFLKGETVPDTIFTNDSVSIPDDLSGYVLKPLFSFAGKGVNVHPSKADLDAIPADQRDKWVLQRKVVYAPCIATPYGPNKVEIRIMLVWFEDAAEPLPVMSLARTGRGELMGARYNVDPWTGSSGCLSAP